MSPNSDVPSGLIADIYDAAAREDGLACIAESIAGFMGVRGAVVMLHRSGVPPETYASEVIREQNHLYMAYYHRLDPWREAGFAGGPDRVFLASELFPERDLVQTRFYTEFARHMGMFRPLSGYLDLGAGQLAAFGVEEPFATQLFEPQDKGRLDSLLPFVKRALRLRLDVNALRSRADLGFRALDTLGVGVVVCRADATVVHANPAAHRLSERGIRISPRGEPIQSGGEGESAKLRRLIGEAAAGERGSMRLHGGTHEPIATLVTPVPDGVGLPGGHAMLTLRVESAVPAPTVAILRSLYGLSLIQAQLCVSLAAGRTFEECAAERAVSVTTARSHFTAILRRTETSNLRDLLRLLGALPDVCDG